MMTIWKFSRNIGLRATVFCVIAWLAFGYVGTFASISFLANHPSPLAVLLVVGWIVLGLGGLVGYWCISWHLNFKRLGYRIEWIAGDDWLYQERQSTALIESLPFGRTTLGDGYPAPCEVRIPDAEHWDRQMPAWARGRRDEIMKRIAIASGADIGGKVSFKTMNG